MVYMKHNSHSNKADAEHEAKLLRKHGHKVRIRKDPVTGHWIVEIFTLALAFGILGAALRR